MPWSQTLAQNEGLSVPGHRSFRPSYSFNARRRRRVGAGGFMYAVIRTGGKQYRVAPGDVVKIESVISEDQTVEFNDVLAVSGDPGTVAKPATAKVTAEVLGEGRGDKILVFHLKRKKQYKKLQGHRQNFTEVRIKAIEADGVTYTAAV
jgi:large subunit ribosomal protein L21